MKPIKRNIVRARRGQLSAFIRLFPLRLSGALRWNTRRDSSEMGWIRITAAHHSTLQWKFSSDFSCSWLHHSILTWDLNKIKATTLASSVSVFWIIWIYFCLLLCVGGKNSAVTDTKRVSRSKEISSHVNLRMKHWRSIWFEKFEGSDFVLFFHLQAQITIPGAMRGAFQPLS